MSDVLLTINAGSSSVKFALFAHAQTIPEAPQISGQIDGLNAHPHLKAKDATGTVIDDCDLPFTGTGQHRAAMSFFVDWLRAHDAGSQIVGVGHRVVHGSDKFSRPMRLSDATLETLRSFIPLAPLHQPHNIAGIQALTSALPGVPQIACFDTAFHRTQPEVAQQFALPRAITAEGVKRYGFHGLSYEYIADVLPQHLGAKADGRIVVAHLGNGASMCAMHARRSVATTMGFTALDGLMMGTRAGNLDPGVLLYLMDYRGLDSKRLEKLLYKESGLLGVSGISQDMRELLASSQPEAAEAVDLFCYRIIREIGSLAAALGGLDALVFTGGIGEHSAEVRTRVCTALKWLGVEFDPAANDRHERLISTPDASTAVCVIPTNEEWMIARHTAALLS